jgi:hypothetical protein
MNRILLCIWLLLPIVACAQTRLSISTGTSANDGSGDSLRTAFNKVNTNTATLWASIYTNGAPKVSTNVTLLGPTYVDGNLTNGFELQDISQLTLDGTDTGVYGVATLFLDGGISTVRGVTNLNLITPGVTAGTVSNGWVLTLSDSVEGTVEFAQLPGAIITGTATLSSGAATVSNTNVATGSRIFLTTQSVSGTHGYLRVISRTAGVSFVVNSSSGSDNSTFAWMIVQP